MEAGLHVRDILRNIHATDLRHITLEFPIDIPQTVAQFCRQLFEQNTRDAFSVLDRAIVPVNPRLFVVTVDIQGLRTAHRPRKGLLQTSVARAFPYLSEMSLTSGATRDVPNTDSPINLLTLHPSNFASWAWERTRPPDAEISFHLLLCHNRAAPLVSSSSDTVFTSDHRHRDTTFAVRYRPIRECSSVSAHHLRVISHVTRPVTSA